MEEEYFDVDEIYFISFADTCFGKNLLTYKVFNLIFLNMKIKMK